MSTVPVLSAAVPEQTAGQAGLRPQELSLYEAPEPRGPECVPGAGAGGGQVPGGGQLEETVSAVRRSVEPSFSWCRSTYHKIKPKIQHGVQLCSDTYTFLREPPPDFLPRAAVVGFTGILGLFAARGSRVKSLLYPSGLMAVTASLYYPERAASITMTTGNRVYAGAVQGYATIEKILKPAAEESGTLSEKKP